MKSTFFHLPVPGFFLSFSYLLKSYPVPSMSLWMARSILSVVEWYLVVHNAYHIVFAHFSGQSVGKWLILHLGHCSWMFRERVLFQQKDFISLDYRHSIGAVHYRPTQVSALDLSSLIFLLILWEFHTMNFDPTHSNFFHFHPNFMSFFFLKSLSPVCAAHIFLGVGPSRGMWPAYQRPYP